MTNQRRTPNPSMNPVAQVLLVVSNLALASAVTYHVLRLEQELVLAPAPPVTEVKTIAPPIASQPPAIDLDLSPVLKSIGALDESIAYLSHSVQRFNTSVVQYDFLQKEIERYRNLDQALTDRMVKEKAKVSGGSNKTMEDLKQLQAQVKEEVDRRRKLLEQLLIEIERKPGAATTEQPAPSQRIPAKAADPNQAPKATVVGPESEAPATAPATAKPASGTKPKAE